MNNDRTRPFILKPVFYCAPVSWAEKYFRGKLREYRDNHLEFDEYLTEVENEIKSRELTYCENILLFLKGKSKTNWFSSRKSLFEMLIKLFNYDFSANQTVDYIEKCYSTYEFLTNNEYKISTEYKVFSKACTWDNSSRDFVGLRLIPINEPKDWNDNYWIDIIFCSLQMVGGDPDHFYDNEIQLRSGRDIYQDTLYLFDYYQGSKFCHKCLKTAISELLKHHVIDTPSIVTNDYFTLLCYKINKPHSFEIKEQ